MRIERLARLVVVASSIGAFALIACSGSGQRIPNAAPAASGNSAPAGAAEAGAADAGAHEKVFAGSAAEATQLVSAAIDKNRESMAACVSDYRKRKNLGRARVEVQVGIDQEGNLLGATLGKGKQDQELTQCMQRALQNATFPRSHAGVISVTKVYEEILQ